MIAVGLQSERFYLHEEGTWPAERRGPRADPQLGLDTPLQFRAFGCLVGGAPKIKASMSAERTQGPTP
jgi:hypothetical protein